MLRIHNIFSRKCQLTECIECSEYSSPEVINGEMLHLDRVAKRSRVMKWNEHLFRDTPLMNDATCEGINNALPIRC
jgi:hypothetical protein